MKMNKEQESRNISVFVLDLNWVWHKYSHQGWILLLLFKCYYKSKDH